MGIECALKHDLLHVRRKYPQHHKDVCVIGRRGDLQLDGRGSSDLDRCSHRFSDEVAAGAGALKASLALHFGSFGSQFMPVGGKMKSGPLRSRYRPFILMPYHEPFSGMADIELNPRLLVPAILLTLEEITKEPLLQIDAVVGVVMRPVFDSVDLQPFLLRRRAKEAFEVAARVARLSPPVRRGQHRP